MIGSFLKSILIHGGLAVAMTWIASQDSVLVRGHTGKSGNPGETSLVVWTDPIEVAPEKSKSPKKAIVKKTAPILQTELPTDVKVARPKELESRTETAPEHDNGSNGQMGSGEQVALEVGNGERSNRLGIHTAAIQKKVQSNLKTPGFLVYSVTAQLKIIILKSGDVSKIELIQSSGDPELDLIALESVKKSVPFEPFERELTIMIPVIFRSR